MNQEMHCWMCHSETRKSWLGVVKVEISLYNSNSYHKVVEFNMLREGSQANQDLQLWT